MRNKLVWLAMSVSLVSSPAFAARSAMVLFDEVKVQSNPFTAPSKTVATLRTGDLIQITDDRVKPGGTGKSKRFYQVDTPKGKGWIDEGSAFEFDSEEIFQSYVQGTSTLEMVLDAAPHDKHLETSKVKTIDSQEFLTRALANPELPLNLKSVVIARLSSQADPGTLAALWLKRLPDDTMLDTSANAYESLMQNAYRTLSLEEKQRVFKQGCAILQGRRYLPWLLKTSLSEELPGPLHAALDCIDQASDKKRGAPTGNFKELLGKMRDSQLRKEATERLKKRHLAD